MSSMCAYVSMRVQVAGSECERGKAAGERGRWERKREREIASLMVSASCEQKNIKQPVTTSTKKKKTATLP